MPIPTPTPSLRERTTLQLGGTPQAWFTVNTLHELSDALERTQGSPLLILGGGSNVVCSDAPFAGTVIELNLSGVHVSATGPCSTEPLCFADANARLDAKTLPLTADATHIWLHVAAGEMWDAVVAAACRWGLGGIECLSGIPGKSGATPIQNVGAYGQEISDTLWAVTCMDRETRALRRFSAAECELGYRSSRFKAKNLDQYVVVEIVLRLTKGATGTIRYGELSRQFETVTTPPSIEHVRQTVLKTRAAKSMLLNPTDPNGRNCGSFFLNPMLTRPQLATLQSTTTELVPHFDVDAQHVKVPAAWLIERAGFARGCRCGNVGLSTKHTLCLVAHDNATSVELLNFARSIRDAVGAQFGVVLCPEPVFVGLSW